jgi:hypothetical protein
MTRLPILVALTWSAASSAPCTCRNDWKDSERTDVDHRGRVMAMVAQPRA